MVCFIIIFLPTLLFVYPPFLEWYTSNWIGKFKAVECIYPSRERMEKVEKWVAERLTPLVFKFRKQILGGFGIWTFIMVIFMIVG